MDDYDHNVEQVAQYPNERSLLGLAAFASSLSIR
jgi:hypothetical protein